MSSETARSSKRRGQQWERDVAKAATAWFPGARRRGETGEEGPGDLDWVGDRIVECTIQSMAELAGKMKQAESDAIRSGFRDYWVVKRAYGLPVRRAYMITRLEIGMPLLCRLDRLEQWEAEQSAMREGAL